MMTKALKPHNLKKMITLLFLLGVATEIFAAQSREGPPSYNLEKDARVARASERTRVKRREWKEKEQEATALSWEIYGLRNEVRRQRRSVQELREKLRIAQEKKKNLPTIKQKLDRATRVHEQKVQEKNRMWKEWGQAKGRKQGSDSRLALAKRRYQEALRVCQGQKTKNECHNDPKVLAAKRTLTEKERENRRVTEEVARVAKKSREVERQMNEALQEKNRLSRKYSQNKSSASPERIRELSKKLDRGERRLRRVRRRFQETQFVHQQVTLLLPSLENNYRMAEENERHIRHQLQEEIEYSYFDGHGEAASSGGSDGLKLAQQLGERAGSANGQSEGRQRGTREGQKRDYEKGHSEGAQAGEERARLRGEADGRSIGRREGNRAAGQTEGRADGLQRAEASNASQVGQNQGYAEGLKKATEHGRRIGRAAGEKRAIDRYEGEVLESVVVDAVSVPFPGTFNQGLPPYQDVSTPYFLKESCNKYSRHLVHVACVDGVEYGYQASRSQSYQQNIGIYYNQAYEMASAQAYQEAIAVYYEQSYQSGYSQGEGESYNRLYSQIKEKFRIQERQLALNNPDRLSADYQDTFKATTSKSYSDRYEEIRLKTFHIAREEAYEQNLESQKQHFNEVRYDEVVAFYNDNSILEYMSFTARDAGATGGVGAGDGVYQPGERVAYDVVIKNYGYQEARGVTLETAGGDKRALPAIPARSIALVKGALIALVPNTKGQQFSLGVLVQKKLNSVDQALEGRYYQNPSLGHLNALEKIFIQVQYPFSVEDMKVEGALLLGTDTAYAFSVGNISSVNYEGPIELHVTTSQGSEVLTSTPSHFSRLSSGSFKRAQGRVLIQDEGSAFEHLTFEVTVVKNGVVVGREQGLGSKLVQIGYRENKTTPLVLLGDGLKDPTPLLDALGNLGGLEKASVFDVSVNHKKMIGQGAFSEKILVFPETKGLSREILSSLDWLVHSNENMAIASQSQYNQLDSLRQLPFMNLAVNQVVLIPSVQGNIPVSLFFINHYAQPHMKDGVIVFEAEDQGETLETYGLVSRHFYEKGSLVEKALSSIRKDDVERALESKVVPSEHRTYIQALLSAVVIDALKLNAYYYSDKSAGKKVIAKVNEDPSSLLNQTLEVLEGALKEGDTDRVITGVIILEELRHLISFHDTVSDMTGRIKRSMASRLDRTKERLHTYLERRQRIFYRKFVGARKSNRLLGHFKPIL